MDARNVSHGGGDRRGARKAIMVIAVLMMLAYLIMWIIMPTSLYRYKLTPKLKAKMTSTYFGTQGQSILIFTFPMIFIALLGSVYLHLGKQTHDHGVSRKDEKKEDRLAIWRRPVLVRGPLGIVSGIELSFLIMFLALLVWSLSTFLHVGYDRLTIEAGEKRWLAKWETTVFRIGLTGNICLALLFYPVTRGSTILPMLGLTSEASVKYHMWLGHTAVALFTTHGLGYLLFWAVSGQLSEALKWDKVGVSNVAGELALLSGLIMWVATVPRIRRKMFEVFFYTHYLYIAFIFFFFLHAGISYAFYMLPGIYLFMIDRYLRFLQSRQRVRFLSARTLSSSEAVELNFAKSPSLSYNPTSTIFISFPAISKLQWHPFTITSSSNLENDRLSVMIKVGGSWTRKVFDMVSSSSVDRLEVSVEGPYGPASNHFLRYDTLVMISGGSGITPFISIIRELLFASSSLKSQMPKILLISSFKNSSDLSILNFILPLSSTSFDLSRLDLQINAYVTKEKHAPDHITQPQSIWFKPKISDAPISPSLGKNGHLWLGAIIASSFISFLVFMGILTKYLIYPIDHNTNKIYSTAGRTILYLLILCISIAVTSSFAVIWNKKRNVTETKQIINMEGVTPQATPESRYYNADRELESLPHQSLLESTEVHYGERPDLKRLLFGLKESNVGVLACGPKALRHEVAAICASGLADNLHFESISFTW